MKYRADIDGLRAIAVLSVVWFHYGAPLPAKYQLHGGFTGVDVFFVISGFLITSNLYADIKNGAFSVLGFYDRRVRRILPALLVVLASTLLAGHFLLMPGDYMSLAASSGAAVFGASNFYFLSSTGYFDQSSELMPLLHTWSLAVEEQFYLVWPLLLFAIAKAGNRVNIAAIVAVIVIVGFGGSLVWMDADLKAAFYMVAPRAWELAIGALLVFLPPLSRRLGEIATITGFVVICAGFSVVREKAFPGVAALYPCIGTALVIWPRTSSTMTGNWLGRLSPIGLISYSLYLWHWPVWVLFRIYINNGTPRIREAIALAIISTALATASYFFIEKPFRKKRWQPIRSVQAGIFVCTFLFCASMYIHSDAGGPERIPKEAVAMSSLDIMWNWPCRQISGVGTELGFCEFGEDWKVAHTKAFLWGDSHAQVFAPLIEQAAKNKGISFILSRQCFPIADGEAVKYSYSRNKWTEVFCSQERKKIIASLASRNDIDLVILAASWAIAKNSIYDGEALDRIEQGFDNTLAAITKPGRAVVIVTAVPYWDHDPLPCEVSSLVPFPRRRCSDDERFISKAKFETQLGTANIIDRVAQRYGAKVVHAGAGMCRSEKCVSALNGEPLYRDGSHMRRNLSSKTKADLSKLIGFDSLFDAMYTTSRMPSSEASAK